MKAIIIVTTHWIVKPKLQSIHKKMGPGSGELPYLAIFRDFIVHSAVLRTLKFEKGCLNWGSNRRMHCCRRGQTAWILMVFPNSVLLGQNLAEILFLLWLAFWTKKLQKHNWKRIPYGIAEKNSKKTQRLTHLWPKARSSFFSEWTVVQVANASARM